MGKNNYNLSQGEILTIWISAVLFGLAAIITTSLIGSNLSFFFGIVLYLLVTVSTGMTLTLFARLIKQSGCNGCNERR